MYVQQENNRKYKVINNIQELQHTICKNSDIFVTRPPLK